MRERLPHWLRQKAPDSRIMSQMKGLMDKLGLHTICESAICPNIGVCFAQNTATFLILGDTCTRRCAFCAVKKGTPKAVDGEEPRNLVSVVKRLGLNYVVITSVTRDDLSDGGAAHFAKIIRMLHEETAHVNVEVLIPDFGGSQQSLMSVVSASPQVINHNLETVPRLYKEVRPGANYDYSVRLIYEVKDADPEIATKSGLMVGLGETRDEVIEVMNDLREAACDFLTIGQYLQPSPNCHQVSRFLNPEEFVEYSEIGKEMGFTDVMAGPMVRSSYRASELFLKRKRTADSFLTSKRMAHPDLLLSKLNHY